MHQTIQSITSKWRLDLVPLATLVSTLTWSCPIPLNYSRSLCSGWLWWCSTLTFPSNSGKGLLSNDRINSLTINAVVTYIRKTMLVILITLNISRYDFFFLIWSFVLLCYFLNFSSISNDLLTYVAVYEFTNFRAHFIIMVLKKCFWSFDNS